MKYIKASVTLAAIIASLTLAFVHPALGAGVALLIGTIIIIACARLSLVEFFDG